MVEPFVLISLVILGLITVLLAVFLKRKKRRREPDYRTLFSLGLVFFIIGIAADISVFFILGLVYLVMGLANKSKWGKKRRSLTKRQIKTQKIIITALTVLVILGAVVFVLGKYFIVPSSKCGIEQCHGLDITCGPNVPDVCTEIYQIGDRCRQYVSCGDGCRLVKTERFEECKSCVEKCLEDFADDGSKAFECESEC